MNSKDKQTSSDAAKLQEHIYLTAIAEQQKSSLDGKGKEVKDEEEKSTET